MTSPHVRVSVHHEILISIADAAAASEEIETGGLLLGWWDAGHIVARHAIEVPDPEATRTRWTRDETHAQHALDAALASFDHTWLGYIGDWHTHPADCGPSSQDERSIRRASCEYQQPLLLLVHRTDNSLEGRVAHRGDICTFTINHAPGEPRGIS